MDIDENLSILRIKRKRGAASAAVDALVFQNEEGQSSSKRMRVQAAEEPTFRFAATVESASFATEKERTALSQRVRTLMAANSEAEIVSSGSVSKSSSSSTSKIATDNAQSATLKPKKWPKYRVVPAATTSKTKTSKSAFHVVDLEAEPATPAIPVRRISARNVESQRHRQRMHDESDARKRRLKDDALMASFMPMLRDYLSLDDQADLSSSAAFDSVRHLSPPGGDSPPATPVKKDEDSDDDDYVYDIYYRTTTYALNPISSDATRIGQLSLLDIDDILLHRRDNLSSDEEVGDEADQDSNDEAFYANDYPDEEKDFAEFEDSDNNNNSDTDASDHSDDFRHRRSE